MTPELLRRQKALAKVLLKYEGKPFRRGVIDCVPMLRTHLVAMEHKRLPKIPIYRNAAQAKRALAERGWANLEQMLDSMLPRIPYAAALVGDVVLVRGADDLDAIALKISARKVVGWLGGYDVMVKYTPHETIGAWRA